MSPHSHTPPLLLAAAWLLLLVNSYNWARDDTGDTESKNDQVIILKKNAKKSAIRIKTTEANAILRRVNEALADHPEGSRARMMLRSVFSNHPDHYGMNAYPYAVVPLNDQGQPHGIERFFDIGAGGGRSSRTTPWQNGKRHGEERFYAGTNLKATIPWVHGKVHGVRKTFYPDGTVQVETTYQHGLANGEQRHYDPKGRLVRLAKLKRDKRHGTVKDFWPDTGKVRREIPYDAGKVHGSVKDYYANGTLKREMPFKNDALHGVESSYNADGKVSRKRYWLNGEPVSKTQFDKESGKKKINP